MMDEYRKVYEQFRAAATEMTDPIAFYRHVIANGQARYFAYLLLRDHYDKNLMECIAIEEEARKNSPT